MAAIRSLITRRREFQRALHAWYKVHHRRLPWRESPSLYRTVVSEFMLQQTQVATVLPYFDRWMRALPDFAALAAAPETRVIKLWEGLGYYSRARNLQTLARTLLSLPAPPRTPAGWSELPGVGPYTAAAITSIAFAEPAACVDGNVVRILARLTGVGRRFRNSTAAARHFAPLAGRLIAGADPGMHNQAMMELGATVCLRTHPKCTACPVARYCSACSGGLQNDLPRFVKKSVKKLAVVRIFCRHRGRLLLHRAGDDARRFAGIYELPEAADLGIRPGAPTLLVSKRRVITRFQITEHIHSAGPTAALSRRIDKDPRLGWVPLRKLDLVTLSGPHRRWVGELLNPDTNPRR